MPPIKGIGALASGLTSKPVDTVKSLLFDPECTPFVSKLLLAAELVLCILIVKMVPCEFIFWSLAVRRGYALRTVTRGFRWRTDPAAYHPTLTATGATFLLLFLSSSFFLLSLPLTIPFVAWGDMASRCSCGDGTLLLVYADSRDLHFFFLFSPFALFLFFPCDFRKILRLTGVPIWTR